MPATRETPSGDAAASLEPWSALPTVHGRVVSRRRLTRDLWELTLGGFGTVDGRPWTERLTGGDQFVHVLVSPEPGGIRPDYRMADLLERRPGDPVRGAYYTVRRARPDAGELDVWVVDHGAPASVGEWMSTSIADDRLALWGPRRGFQVPHDVRHALFVADETGIAAVAAMIERLPLDRRATAVLECRGDAHRPPVPVHPGVTVIWVERGDRLPGAGNRLLTAVRPIVDMAPDAVFGAAESRHITEIRHLVRRLALGPDRAMLTGYWRREVG